jgi:hypothetical protein
VQPRGGLATAAGRSGGGGCGRVELIANLSFGCTVWKREHSREVRGRRNSESGLCGEWKQIYLALVRIQVATVWGFMEDGADEGRWC